MSAAMLFDTAEETGGGDGMKDGWGHIIHCRITDEARRFENQRECTRDG
jgi:hypothetical protein